MRTHLLLVSSAILLGPALLSCAPPPNPRSPDPTRASTPVPACALPLPPRQNKDFARQIPERDYWNLIVPGLGKDDFEPTNSTTSCNGLPVFAADTMRDATFVRDARSNDELVYGAGQNRLKVVWLQTHAGAGHDRVGPLALTRVLEDYAEVYGVTLYRGNPAQSRFGTERLGPDLLVTAIQEGCQGVTVGTSCTTRLQVFLLSAGQLKDVGQFDLEKRVSRSSGETGVSGSVHYHLTSSPSFQPDGLHIMESIEVTDSVGRKVRQADMERHLRLSGDRLMSDESALWKRVFPGNETSAEPSDAPESAPETTAPSDEPPPPPAE